MRITGGMFCRQQIKAPAGECRPTQDMVREALFSIIGPVLGGKRFLDLFAGSGAVGLEALSRGAASVCWVESNRRTLATLKENVSAICSKAKGFDFSGRTGFFGGDALSFLGKELESQQFDLIFADPPYDREGRVDWLSKILGLLAGGNVLAPGGLFVMEQSDREEFKDHIAWDLIKDRTYGSTRLRFFVRKENEGA